MKQFVLVALGVVCVSATLTGCGLLRQSVGLMVNERDNYLEAAEAETISVPSDLEGERIADIWEIPQIEEIPAAKYYANAAPRPISIVGDADPNLIRIQKLGERSWMVVQRKPDTVWPLVRQFLTFNGAEVATEDPNEGVIVTKPLDVTATRSTSMLHTTIRAENPEASDDDFLVFRVEQGMRRGSSEVHLKYLDDENQLKYIDWSLPSAHSEVTNSILRQIAQFEVDDVSDEAVSRVGQEVAVVPKIELVRNDVGFPSLRFNVDFERAWATVLSAIERSPYDVATRERTTRLIELVIDESKLDRTQRESLGQLLLDIRKSESTEAPLAIQLRVNPYQQVNEIELQRSDGNELTLELAEHFLVMIQQFSS
ncbi:MAG: outer membrane protein assembly factor BamC [Gammaproteobacteria bacterium]|nr:outer membrane protein assembly factor BamC [Gammaproteobacteria bacterium]